LTEKTIHHRGIDRKKKVGERREGWEAVRLPRKQKFRLSSHSYTKGRAVEIDTTFSIKEPARKGSGKLHF